MPVETRHVLYGALVGGPSVGQRRLHRQPRRLRDERGGHRLQRRLHLRAGPADLRVRRHAAGELPGRRDAGHRRADGGDHGDAGRTSGHRGQGDRLQQVRVPGPRADRRPSSATTSGRDGTGAVQVTAGYTQGCPSPTTAKQSQRRHLVRRGGLRRATPSPRPGQSPHRMEVQFKIGVPEGGTWDPTNDPSYQATAGPEPEGAALRRHHPGLGRRAGPGRPGHHRADRPRHPGGVQPRPPHRSR